jgi:hypothetical protein
LLFFQPPLVLFATFCGLRRGAVVSFCPQYQRVERICETLAHGPETNPLATSPFRLHSRWA